jgi:hypothetical protein
MKSFESGRELGTRSHPQKVVVGLGWSLRMGILNKFLGVEAAIQEHTLSSMALIDVGDGRNFKKYA